MNVTIQVEDPRGENVSPMDEKTITADCVIQVELWCESIHVMEENSDGDSEGGSAPLLTLIAEFIELLRPDKRETELDKVASDATETLPDLVRLAAVLRTAETMVATEIDRYRDFITASDVAHNAVCDEKNRLHRIELNKRRKPQ